MQPIGFGPSSRGPLALIELAALHARATL